jgi:hypothetical protein
MFLEILFGIIIAIILMYLFYLYLEWCDKHSANLELHQHAANFLLPADREYLDTYGKYMLPVYLADTYKPIRFWILYYSAKYF